MSKLTEERKREIRNQHEGWLAKDQASVSAGQRQDSTIIVELLSEIDRLEGANNDWKRVVALLNSELEEAKAKNERMANALDILSQVSLCRPCGVYNQNLIDDINEMTKEKV